jgi:EAL domain-containing protein (putative c-di-GMP-specific phosphodiesterase class I)
MNMMKDENSRYIVSTITKLGHSLNMTIVAEGVETKEDTEILRSYGVDYFQGYFFSKPLPLLEFQHMLTRE